MNFLQTIGGWLSVIGTFALSNILPAVIIAVIGILAIHLLSKIISGALGKSKLEKNARDLILSVLKIVLYVLLGLIIASRLGIDVTGIVALASVLTLAISLSVQNALTNLIGGFTLLYTKPFVSGDFVEVAGQSGTVQEVGLTYTKLATADNKMVSIPNSAVVSAEIVNYSVTGTRRVDVAICASYDAPIDDVLDALRQAAQVDTILPEKAPFAAVKNYGDSAIEYVLQIWCNTPDYWSTLFTVNKNVKDIFDARGIQMTYPHINVHLDK